jgi:hypothetical protein
MEADRSRPANEDNAMSRRIAFAIAALAALGAGAAHARTTPPKQQPTHPAHAGNTASHAANPHNRRHQHCYYLPTVNNGSVSGLKLTCSGG